VFELEGFTVNGPGGAILRVPRLLVRDHAVTAVIGPVGTGKSLLLRALAGVRPPGDVRFEGTLRFQGALRSIDRDAPYNEVSWIGQSRAEPDLSVSDVLKRSQCHAFLLDEIERRVQPGQRGALVEALRHLRQTAAVVMVTHDMSFAREVADDVHLVCAGEIATSADAARFFQAPPSELAARFVRDGNCWPRSAGPALAPSFRWVLEDRLAGTCKPGLTRDIEDDLGSMALAGITEIVSLTEEPPPVERLRSFGFASRHFPIPDMGVPALGPAITLCRQIERAVSGGERIAVHCAAGLGRTGTILASVLLLGEAVDAADAIRRVRLVEPRMIQNRAQEHFVERVAEALGRS
jgi:ABC-type Mn2+/Zn2+ transport system ATPase subunit